MKRRFDERSGGATAWIRSVDTCQGLPPRTAVLPAVFCTPQASARTAPDTPAAYSAQPARTVHPLHTSAASRSDGCRRRWTVDDGAASEPKTEPERAFGMNGYGRWSRDGTRPRCSRMRSRPPATDHGTDRPDPQTAALAR